MPPVSSATQQILEALQRGGYIETTDPKAALAALKGRDRGAVAANVHRLNVGVFNPADIAAFLNWVYNGGLTAAELERRSGVVLAMGAREVLARHGISLIAGLGPEFLVPDLFDPVWGEISLVMGMVVPTWRTIYVFESNQFVFMGLDGSRIIVGNDGTTLWTIHRGFEKNGYFPQVPNWRAEWERLQDLVDSLSPDLRDVVYGGEGVQSPEKVADVFNLARSQMRLYFGDKLSGTDGQPVNDQMHRLLAELDSVLLAATTSWHTLTYEQAYRAEHFLMVLHNAIHPREDEFARARRAMQHVLQLTNPPEIRVVDAAKLERSFGEVTDRVKSLTNNRVLRVMTEHDFNVFGTTADCKGWIFAYKGPAAEADQLGTLGVGRLLMEPATPAPWGKEGDRAAVLYRSEYPREWGDYARRSSQGWEYPFAITVKNGKPWFAFYIDESKIGTGNDPAVTVDHLTWPEDFKLPDPYGAAGGEGWNLLTRSEADRVAAIFADIAERDRVADAARLAAAVSALCDRDWCEAMVDGLVSLVEQYNWRPYPVGSSPDVNWRRPLKVYGKVTVCDPAAVYDVIYGEDGPYSEEIGAYEHRDLLFNLKLGDPAGIESLDRTLLHVLRTDSRLRPLLQGVAFVSIETRGFIGSQSDAPGRYDFAVTYDGQLVNLIEDSRYWGHDFQPVAEKVSQHLAKAIETTARKSGLNVESGIFVTGFESSKEKHHAILVSDGADAPIAQITFGQTADGQVVVFLDQASHFGTGLMAPNMRNNFFVRLFDVIPRGTLVRGTYRLENGDPNFGVWHLPEGAEFPEQYVPPEGYFLSSRDDATSPSPSLQRRGDAEATAGPVRSDIHDAPFAGDSINRTPTREGGEGDGEPKALAQSTVVRRLPTVGADQRVRPVVIRSQEIIAGGSLYGNTALKLDSAVIAEPSVVLDPQPRLRLVESEQPTDDSTIKQLLVSDTSPSANDNVKLPDDHFPSASNIIHTVGASRIGVHGTAAVRLLALH